jgi:glycosyltransferase involved in cell wall biosynthesis
MRITNPVAAESAIESCRAPWRIPARRRFFHRQTHDGCHRPESLFFPKVEIRARPHKMDRIRNRYRFSIVTPTYNRAHLLEQVYSSLKAQTLHDFEWMVVDDGSTDNTRSVVDDLAAKATFSVSYIHQPNCGKHVAVNAGIRVACGYFIGILDSDDKYAPNALQSCWQHWQQIPEAERSRFVGLTGLCVAEDGRIIGDRYPTDPFDSDPIECCTRIKIKGDKKGFLRTDVLRQFPFPEDLGRFVPEGIVWNRIARQFKTRYLNEVWAVVEYRADGLTAHSVSTRVKSPNAALLYYKELLGCGRALPLTSRIRNSANLLRFSLHARSFASCAGRAADTTDAFSSARRCNVRARQDQAGNLASPFPMKTTSINSAPINYPRRAPQCRMLTPVGLRRLLRDLGLQVAKEASAISVHFHDNFDPTSWDGCDDGGNVCHAVLAS